MGVVFLYAVKDTDFASVFDPKKKKVKNLLNNELPFRKK